MDPTEGVPAAPLVLALLGAGLLIGGLQTVHFGDQPEFHHRVQAGPADDDALNDALASIDRDALERADVVFEYTELSPTAKDAFRTGLAADDGRVTRRGEGKGAPEFAYPGHYHAPDAGEYYVAYEGDYYRVETSGDSGFPGLPEVFAATVALLVGVPLGLGGLALTDRLRVTASSLAGLWAVTVLSVIDFDWFGLTGLVELLGVGLLSGALAGVVAWTALGLVPGDILRNFGAERPLTRRSWLGGVFGSAGLWLLFVLNVGLLGLSGLIDLAMVAVLSFAVPAGVAWHGLDVAARRAWANRRGRH